MNRSGKQSVCVGVNPENTSRKTKILIVEDEPLVAMMMVDLLSQADCEAEVAWNAERAMQLAQDGYFDLITLDIALPVTNGFEICRQLKENSRLCKTPVVVVSGRLHQEDEWLSAQLGAVDYITKPFDAVNFGSRILSHIKLVQTEEIHVPNCLKRKMRLRCQQRHGGHARW